MDRNRRGRREEDIQNNAHSCLYLRVIMECSVFKFTFGFGFCVLQIVYGTVTGGGTTERSERRAEKAI